MTDLTISWRRLAVAAAAIGLADCTTGREAVVRAPERCVDQTVAIYFEPNSAEVTREGRAVIFAAAQAAKSCKVTSVEVIGLADAAGTPEVGLAVSKRRADSVAQALDSAGLPGAEYKLAAAGQADSVNARGQSRPLRRRADIILHETER